MLFQYSKNSNIPIIFHNIKNRSTMRIITLSLLTLCLCFQALAQEKVDENANKIIRKYGIEQSQVMDIASWMTDVYGPRLTGSPMLDKATDWAVKTLKDWGMENVHTEQWGPFGRGWELKKFSLSATVPSAYPIIAYPKAWSPAVKGTLTGEVIYLDAGNEADLAQYKGKLKGKFVLLDTARVVTEWTKPMAIRLESEGLLDMANASKPTPGTGRVFRGNNTGFGAALWKFIYEEKPLCVLDRSFKGDSGGARQRRTSQRHERRGITTGHTGNRILQSYFPLVEKRNSGDTRHGIGCHLHQPG
jgi:hypothetical protein